MEVLAATTSEALFDEKHLLLINVVQNCLCILDSATVFRTAVNGCYDRKLLCFRENERLHFLASKLIYSINRTEHKMKLVYVVL